MGRPNAYFPLGVGGGVGVESARLNRWKYFQTRFEFTRDPHHWAAYPTIRRQRSSIFFRRVLDEIKDFWHAQFDGRTPPISFCFVEGHLVVTPLHCLHPIRHKDGESFARGMLGLPKQKVGLIYSINGAVLRNCRTRELDEGCECVHFVHDLIADPTCGEVSGPANDKWCA